MRIISLGAHYQDGLGYQDYYLGKSFMSLGHEVIYIAGDWHFNYPDYDNTVKSIIGERYVGHGKFKTEFGADLYRLKTKQYLGKYVLPGINELILSLKPDFIICHSIFNLYSYGIAKLALENNLRVVFDDHTTANVKNTSFKNKILQQIFRLFVTKKIQQAAEKIIAISDSVVPFLQHDLGFKDVSIIPLGTDTALFYKDEKGRAKKREELKVDEKQVLITYTGKIYDEKRVDLIIEALLNINVDYSKIVLLFVGPLAKDYENIFNDLIKNKPFRIIYVNSVPPYQLKDFYNASDICCWPAHTTGSTVDASACGCPIICNSIMSERYSYENGFGIDNADVNQLKSYLQKLIDSKELRATMGLKGIDYIEKELSWNAIAQKFIS